MAFAVWYPIYVAYNIYFLLRAKKFEFSAVRVELADKKEIRRYRCTTLRLYFANGDKCNAARMPIKQWMYMFANGGISVYNSSNPRDIFYLVKIKGEKRSGLFYNTNFFEYKEQD